jgi:hypothetical protein
MSFYLSNVDRGSSASASLNRLLIEQYVPKMKQVEVAQQDLDSVGVKAIKLPEQLPWYVLLAVSCTELIQLGILTDWHGSLICPVKCSRSLRTSKSSTNS